MQPRDHQQIITGLKGRCELNQAHVKDFDKIVIYVFLSHLRMFLRLCSFLRFWLLKNHPENHHSSLQYIIRFPNNLLFKLCFKILKCFQDYVNSLYFLHLRNHQKIITGLKESREMNRIYFSSLKHMWRFLKNLLVKLFLSYLEVFLRLCSILTVFSAKETPRNCHISHQWVLHPPNFFESFADILRLLAKSLVKMRSGDFQ